MDELLQNHQQLELQILAVFLSISLLIYFLSHTIIRIQLQKQALASENKQRTQAEQRLEGALSALQEREHKLALTLNSIGDAVITTDQYSNINSMNPVAEQLTGYTFTQAKGKPLQDAFSIIDAKTRTPIENPADRAMTSGQIIHQDNQTLLLAKDGAELFIADTAAPIRQPDGTILGAILIFNDITEHKQQENQIRTLSQAIEQSPVSVMITDTKARIEYVNSTFEKNTGYCANEVLGKTPSIIKSGSTPAKIYRDMWSTITSGSVWQGELMNRKKSGEDFWESANIAPVFDKEGKISHYLAVREDISLRKKQEEQILHQAHFDTLTGLPNRFLSMDRLSLVLNKAQRSKELVAVLFIDLDDFKKINDTLGHDTGDKLLIEAAERLQGAVRDEDTVGRLGGDEFIVILSGLDSPEDARPVVENLLHRFRDSFQIDGRALLITASIGIAISPNDGDTPSVLLRNADSAMYYSKDEGRNTYSYFTSAMNKNVSRRLALEEQMHGALSRNEFSVVYQPKIEISNGNISGVEALLRWHNPALGQIPPDEFIPIAEQTGMIIAIGEFVLTEAISQTHLWQQQFGPQFSVAVNLSPSQFRALNLIPFIKQTLKEANVSPGSLELEITEGVLLNGHTNTKSSLNQLHSLGISLAMDDFGTGYSSLSYLRSYPFDVLKIDRSFINDISEDKADLQLVNATIAMAHSLGLKVVAEGVETEEQLALLAEQKCDIGQGYLFSKPVSAEAISAMPVQTTASA